MTTLAQTVLEARGVSKSFGSHVAPDRVDFQVKAGQVHALLGENGAGKSTLIKSLTGVYHPDAGQVLMDGARVDLRDPQHTTSARCARRSTCCRTGRW
ncbi:MAG: ATP-binding cassette domain-containing protein [Candidatus Saccharibacteria bacterium]|nr:ATP-binding cassette domain-containing protein [Pseudorhodobacter sp.]